MPFVLCNGSKLFLVYFAIERDLQTDTVALIEFIGDTFRFGIVNDEALSGHPLWNNGLAYYSAHVIENSSWIAELKAIHKVHPYYDEKHWEEKMHLLLAFHDEIFEVIATDYKIETFQLPFNDVVVEAFNRMK